MRMQTDDGAQIVVVDGRYSFAWNGTPKLIQDERIVCEGRNAGSRFVGTVTGFGTDYEGKLKPVIERETPLPRSHVDGESRALLAKTIKKKYDNGMSIRDIAYDHGRSYGFIHSLLIESGVTFRRRGGLNR
jgi:hypothetical protein